MQNNKAALALLWYLDVRPNKITLLKINTIFIFHFCKNFPTADSFIIKLSASS
jgi:hypothetical protein